MKILFLPRYEKEGSSSRYRIYQYLEYFRSKGIEIEVQSFFSEGYVKNLYNNIENKKFNILKNYLERFSLIFRVREFDIIFIEKELFPYLPSYFEYLIRISGCKYIVDFDDAIFHTYNTHPNFLIRTFLKNKIAKVISNSFCTITGSPYLTTYAKQYNNKTFEIPTSIDLKKYSVKELEIKENFVIGWIGSKSTSKHLLLVIEAFRIFNEKYNNTILRLIGFDRSLKNEIKNLPIEIIEWYEENEVDNIKKFSVGIMPLFDEPFERGKCGFKLIQYMACGLPTISTPLVANIKINRDNQNLFATNTAEWISALEEIYNNRENYIQIGLKNRVIVEEYYSTQANSKYYIDIFDQLMDNKK